ncbi:uncharacterized protein K02A2.6-like [Topomyia yanbarensis]|uniref:uncharacterized protein K02A2.6-like n=1 Tax=Topomyia yanbarensis TaxID=2498891 RepID=UPI00273CCCE0|nr:uncharacterized protein K02A2.6-like [Topomyia yanbarensis]
MTSLQRYERCSRCNRASHGSQSCPALNKNCNSCGRRGHFAATCRRQRGSVRRDGLSKESASELDNKEQQINALSLEDVLVNCTLALYYPIRFLIDSGADVNVIGGDDWNKLEMVHRSGSILLEPIEVSRNRGLRGYAASTPMSIECAFRSKIQVDGVDNPSVIADFLVVKGGSCSLLGRSTASEMKLLKIGADIFRLEGEPEKVFPKMPGVKVRFSVDQTIPPERNAYYNVPAAYREAAKCRLKEMESSGIIERVTSPPDWISGLSAVPKGKDDFRLVVNMRAPNKAIKRQYYRLPLIEDMKVKLYGAKFFSKLDLSNAYYHLELHAESRDLTTFLAEDGMYRFTRLMFGVNCAPEIFQQEMCRILEPVKNKIVYIDDILLFAESLEELRKIVANTLQILRANNLTLNTTKCEFDRSRIKFVGHELDENGFHIEETKIKDIRRFRHPTTASELRSFLGLAAFVSPYIKDFAKISSPLWAVISSKTWSWDQEQMKAFELLKESIVNCTISLGYFCEKDKTVLYTDASPNALGAVLVQIDNKGSPRIISFASKALTSTEKKYAQNQHEALGAVWAVEYFSHFLLGRQFTLRTDAKGITFILNRTRETSKRALTRADGWALRLSPYRYDVEFIRGLENIADPSSRLYCGHDEAFNEETSPWEIAHLEANTVEFLTEAEIRDATNRDTTLQRVKESLESSDWPKDLQRYKVVSSDLYSKEGLLVKNGCIVVPEELRLKALEVALAGHPQTAKFRSILRERVWWPGITGDAEKWVKSCDACAVNGKPEKHTPMERTLVPRTVWEVIAMDFNGPYAKFEGISILVIIDLRSRFAIARPVKSTAFEYTKKILDDIFQNGLAESFMKVVNKAMSVAVSSGNSYVTELQNAVHAYNAGAHSVIKVPPEEIMMGRKIKRRLPLLEHKKSAHVEELLDSRDYEEIKVVLVLYNFISQYVNIIRQV